MVLFKLSVDSQAAHRQWSSDAPIKKHVLESEMVQLLQQHQQQRLQGWSWSMGLRLGTEIPV